MIELKRVSSIAELEGIRQLQAENQRQNNTEEEAASQGFLPAAYSIDFLTEMHQEAPSLLPWMAIKWQDTPWFQQKQHEMDMICWWVCSMLLMNVNTKEEC